MTTLGGSAKTVTVAFENVDPKVYALMTGQPAKSDAEVVAEVYSLSAAAGLQLGTAAIQAALYQDDDAHEDCSLTACLNPLHPGPCKGWKGTLHSVSPGAWHALEAARVEKANHARVKKIEALKAQGKPIPHKLLAPIVAKPHPQAGQTAKNATGEAHAAGKAVSDAAGIVNNHPGKVSLGQAVKQVPAAKGPKGKKPTLASHGIAFVIGQEKVTPQYKLDKAAAITPEQWAGLSAADKASIRGELAKISINGFGVQEEKANKLLAKLADKPADLKPGTPGTVTTPSGKVHQKVSLKEMEQAAKSTAPPPTEKLKGFDSLPQAEKDKVVAQAPKAELPLKLSEVATPKTAVTTGGKAEAPTVTSLTPTNVAKIIQKYGSADLMIGGKKVTVGFEGSGHPGKLVMAPGGHCVVTTPDGTKHNIAKGQHLDFVWKKPDEPKASPPEAPKPQVVPAAEKPKPLAKHVEHAVAMAQGTAPGASWSKNHLVAYEKLSAEEFKTLSPDVQGKIVSELTKAQTKFLDPKKIAASKALVAKFQGEAPAAPKAEVKAVNFSTHLHDHSVTDAQAKKAADETGPAGHFLAAKQLGVLTDADNPDLGFHALNAADDSAALVAMKTKLYDSSILGQPGVKAAIDELRTAAAKQSYAQSVQAAKTKAFNKINQKIQVDGGTLSPIEKASLLHYGKYLLNHKTPPTDQAHLDDLKADTKQAENVLTDKLQGAFKKANAPAVADMSPAQIADRTKVLLGDLAVNPHVNLSLSEMQYAQKMGEAKVGSEAAKYPKEVLSDPMVAAKMATYTSVVTQINASNAELHNLDDHIQQMHTHAILDGIDQHGNPLSVDDKKVIAAHAGMLKASHSYLGTTLDHQQEKLPEAKAAFEAAAEKAQANLKPAEPLKLSAFDQTTVADAYMSAWSKHASKAVTYGLKSYADQQKMKTHAQYPSLTMDLGELKVLAGKVALAHAEEHTAHLNLQALDPESGVKVTGSPEWSAWQAKVADRLTVEKQFNALHKTAQARLDAIRVDAGLKKRALPKLDTASVKSTAAESGYYKSTGYNAPNYGKPASGKNYLLTKVGPKLAVAHQTASEKKLGALGSPAAPAASTSKIENVPSGEPVKLGGGDSSIAHIPAPLKKQITSDFKAMPKGKYLADPTEDIFGNLVNLAAAHSKGLSDPLSVDQVLKTIDETHSQSLGVANSGMLHKKVTDWLGTSAGKTWAEQHSTPDAKIVKQINGEIDLPKGITLAPGEKVQKLAGPGPHDESLHATAFKAATSTQAQEAQDAYMKANGVKWSAQQRSALKSYTGSAYITYNDYLRGSSSHHSQSTKQHVVDIQSAMLPLGQHTLLKRGTGWNALPPEFHGANASKMVGKTFQEPGFTSTTVAGMGGHFSGQPLQLIIEAPAGTPAAFVNGLSHFKDQENEMLLAAGTKFKVLSVEKTTGGHTLMRVRIVGDK
jgi:hypothetical protein